MQIHGFITDEIGEVDDAFFIKVRDAMRDINDAHGQRREKMYSVVTDNEVVVVGFRDWVGRDPMVFASIGVFFRSDDYVSRLDKNDRVDLQAKVETAALQYAENVGLEAILITYAAGDANHRVLIGSSSRLWPCSACYLSRVRWPYIHDILHRWSVEEPVRRYRRFARDLLEKEGPIEVQDQETLEKLAKLVSKACVNVFNVHIPDLPPQGPAIQPLDANKVTHIHVVY